jgi:long-chain fatty acid transport protein
MQAMHHNVFFFGTCLAASLVIASPAHGQSANYEDVVFGELATGMGGAAIGLADEPSAAFYNPAGLARLDTQVLGLSVQAYGGTWIFVQDFLQARNQGTDQREPVDTSSFGTFPTSLAYSLPLGSFGSLRHALAFSIVAPVHQSYSFSQTLRVPAGVAEITSAASLQETELLGGVSYAIGGDSLSFGATVFTEYASVALENLIVASGIDTSGAGQRYSRARQASGSQFGLTGVVGAHLQMTQRWSLGLRARLPNLALQTSSLHTFLETPSSGSEIAVGGLEGEMKYPHPLGLGFGLGFRSRRLLFGFDAKSYLPMDAYDMFEAPVGEWDANIRVPRSRLVVNFATGAEIFATEGISLLFGLGTNASSRPGSGGTSDTAIASTMSFISASTGIRTHGAAGTFTFNFVARHGAGTIDSMVWRDGLEIGEPTRIDQSSAMLSMSWTRAVNVTAIKSQLDGVTGE